MTEPQITEEERWEIYRLFHAEHLRRQTKAIETIRTIVVTWLVLTIVGAVMWIAVAASSSSGGF